MPERTLLRIGSDSAVLGAILLMVANALHPRGDVEGAVATLKEIADSDIWVTDHLGIAIGALLVLGGLVPSTAPSPQSRNRRGRGWASQAHWCALGS